MFGSIVISIALLVVLGMIFLNKLAQRKVTDAPPRLETLQDKQDYLGKLKYRSKLDSQEWLYVLMGYFILQKLVEIESLDQAYEWLQNQPAEALNVYANEMMNDEGFLDSIIDDLPEELAPLTRDNVDGGADGASFMGIDDSVGSSGDSSGDGGGE